MILEKTVSRGDAEARSKIEMLDNNNCHRFSACGLGPVCLLFSASPRLRVNNYRF